ncbi:FecR family protein [Sphingobacterium faecium]|uniref:FecR family protein n=1 Tax=Sphingobacterium faecium TaxID=34087 RepID=UPI0024684BE5|nr:FecR family protein [Sphingobacterium faecium]MDH5826275.1 FecR family protein [Sphingobacterium faecium]
MAKKTEITGKIVDLLQKYRLNALSEKEYFELKNWIAQDEANKHYLETFIQLYKADNMQMALRNVDPGKAYDKIRSISKRKNNIRKILYACAAACLIAVISTTVILVNRPEIQENRLNSFNFQRLNHPVLFTSSDGQVKKLENGGELKSSNSTDTATIYNTVQTQRGGSFKIILPDESVVWLNANTKIIYPGNFLKDRKVVLEGEAFFEVQKNGSPFIVQTNKSNIQVLGTKFNVSAYAEHPVMTTLVKGSVEVSNSSDKKLLKPNQQAITLSDNSSFEIKTVNTTIYTSWIAGVFEFQNSELEDIMEQLENWYDIEVKYQNPALKKVHFTGSLFRDNSLQYSLQIIQEISDVKFRTEDGQLYVYQ